MLLEYAAKKLIDAATLLAKDALKSILEARNKQALDAKVKQAEQAKKLSPKELSAIVLKADERYSGDVAISTQKHMRAYATI